MNFIVEYAGYKSRKAPLLKGLQWCYLCGVIGKKDYLIKGSCFVAVF